MKRNIIVFSLATFLLAALFIMGSAKISTTAEKGKEGPIKSIELVYASGWPKHHPQVGVFAEKWMARIKDATEGRVKMRGVYGGALLPSEGTLEGLIKQTADAGAVVASYWPGQLKISVSLASTVDLDLGNKLDMKGIVAITEKLYEEFPQFSGEYQKLGLTPLVWLLTPSYALLSTKPIEKLDDLKGKKIRAFGVNLPKLLHAAEAVPLMVATGELFTGLQTGVIDALVTDPPNMMALKLYEVAKHFMATGPGKGALSAGSSVLYVINNKSLGQLSERDQRIVKKVSREMTLEGTDFMIAAWDKAIDEVQKKGVKIRHLSPEETTKWASKCPDWYGLSAESLNKDGLPGTKFMERYKELARDYISGKWKP